MAYHIDRNWLVGEPGPQAVLESGLWEKIVYVYGYKGNRVADKPNKMPTGRLAFCKKGLVFFSDVSNTSKDIANFATKATAEVADELVPGVGLAISLAKLGATIIGKEAARREIIESPNTFFIPYVTMTGFEVIESGHGLSKRKSLIIETEPHQGEKVAYCLTSQTYGNLGIKKSADILCIWGRFLKEIDQLTYVVSDDMFGFGYIKYTNQLLAEYEVRYGKKFNDHKKEFDAECDKYWNEALSQKGVTLSQMKAMVIERLSCFQPIAGLPEFRDSIGKYLATGECEVLPIGIS